jgi:Fe-S oxidoreductase
MLMKNLREYKDTLYGCRFCVMCKPATEVSNLTQLESHTTRARALMLWRIAEGIAEWQPRDIELLYQSTLDSISQAWCVVDYPVSEYVLAARAEVYAAGLAPQAIRQALARFIVAQSVAKNDVLFLASEAAELENESASEPASRALERVGVKPSVATVLNGALAFALGDAPRAAEQAKQVVELIRQCGARTVIADSAQTLWALRRIYPALDVALPDGINVIALSEFFADAIKQRRVSLSRISQKILFHDCRAATLVADAMPQAEAIQPGYRGDEETLGKGTVFDAPRRVLDALGATRLYSAWSRVLCKSCGADDGLWLTNPKLAQGLARQRLDEAKRLGAELLVTDSVLCATHLKRAARDGDVAVKWLPELI